MFTSSIYGAHSRPKAKTARAIKSKNKGFRKSKTEKDEIKVVGVDVDMRLREGNALYMSGWL